MGPTGLRGEPGPAGRKSRFPQQVRRESRELRGAADHGFLVAVLKRTP